MLARDRETKRPRDQTRPDRPDIHTFIHSARSRVTVQHRHKERTVPRTSACSRLSKSAVVAPEGGLLYSFLEGALLSLTRSSFGLLPVFLRFYETDSLKYQFRTVRSNTEHGVMAPSGHGLELVHAWLWVFYWSLSYVSLLCFIIFLSLSLPLSVLCCLVLSEGADRTTDVTRVRMMRISNGV